MTKNVLYKSKDDTSLWLTGETFWFLWNFFPSILRKYLMGGVENSKSSQLIEFGRGTFQLANGIANAFPAPMD